MRERRYAELGYLLPIFIGPAVKTRCVGPSSWHAIYVYPTTVRTFGYTPVGHGAQPQLIFCLRCWSNHPLKTIRPVLLHHPTCHSLCLFLLIEFLNGEYEAVVVAVIDAEHLEPGASPGGTIPA